MIKPLLQPLRDLISEQQQTILDQKNILNKQSEEISEMQETLKRRDKELDSVNNSFKKLKQNVQPHQFIRDNVVEMLRKPIE